MIFPSKYTITKGLTVAALVVAAPAYAGPLDILSGQSIGSVQIGKPVPSSLGKPSRADGGMMKWYATWFSRKGVARNKPAQRLDIFTQTNPDNGYISVEQVRVTSPAFSTANGISTKNKKAEILRRFPAARPLATFQSGKKTYTVYDDVRAGIAFEFAPVTGQCIAISVHRRNVPARALLEVQANSWEEIRPAGSSSNAEPSSPPASSAGHGGY